MVLVRVGLEVADNIEWYAHDGINWRHVSEVCQELDLLILPWQPYNIRQYYCRPGTLLKRIVENPGEITETIYVVEEPGLRIIKRKKKIIGVPGEVEEP